MKLQVLGPWASTATKYAPIKKKKIFELDEEERRNGSRPYQHRHISSLVLPQPKCTKQHNKHYICADPMEENK